METIFWKRLKQLCAEHNTTPTGVCKAVGLSTGSPPAWKRGSLPNPSAREKLAQYFGVDPDYFVTEKEKAPAEKPTGATEDDIKFALFGNAPVTDEDMEAVRTFAQMLAEKARKRNE